MKFDELISLYKSKALSNEDFWQLLSDEKSELDDIIQKVYVGCLYRVGVIVKGTVVDLMKRNIFYADDEVLYDIFSDVIIELKHIVKDIVEYQMRSAKKPKKKIYLNELIESEIKLVVSRIVTAYVNAAKQEQMLVDPIQENEEGETYNLIENGLGTNEEEDEEEDIKARLRAFVDDHIDIFEDYEDKVAVELFFAYIEYSDFSVEYVMDKYGLSKKEVYDKIMKLKEWLLHFDSS